MRVQLLPFLLLVGILACRDDPSAASAARGVTLDLTLSSTTLARGQSNTITMTVTNTTAFPVTLTGGVCEPRPYITDSKNQVVVPPGGVWPCVLSLRRLQLRPGEKFVRSFVWNTGSEAAGAYRVNAAFTSEEVRLVTPEQFVEVT